MSGSEVHAARPPLHHPVVVEHAARRAADIQLRIADRVTAFAGSMPFVYIRPSVKRVSNEPTRTCRHGPELSVIEPDEGSD